MMVFPFSLMPNPVPRHWYDELGEDNFKYLIEQLIYRKNKDANFIPGPTKGKDGGIDSRIVKELNKIDPCYQYKFYTITSYDRSRLRSKVKSDYKKELAKISKNKNVEKYIYITNAALTTSDINELLEFNKSYLELDVEFWEFEKINLLLRENNKLVPEYFKIGLGLRLDEIIQKQETLEADNEKLKRTLETSRFISARDKFKNLLIDDKMRKNILPPLIYLISPVKITAGSNAAIALGGLLDVNFGKLQEYLKALVMMKKINTVNGIYYVVKSEEIIAQIEEMINEKGVDFIYIINLLSGNE